MTRGYISGDLVFTANRWNGAPNAGEFGITGTNFVSSPPITVSVGNIEDGVAVQDDATGTGYLMYSEQAVGTRFSGSLYGYNSEHIIAVRFNGTDWEYNDNTTWITFTTESTDRLLAEVDFTNDTATALAGSEDTYEGITRGYLEGDLAFTPNVWNGVGPAGEFGVTGTSFTVNGPPTYHLGDLGYGVAV
ncbi:hypothetical protein, partial [Calycomorphotria hydatis]